MPGFLNVILDIDETFLHHVSKDVWDSVPDDQRDNFTYTSDASGSSYFVFRPHLKEFAQFLTENTATVNIWTWNSKSYATEVAALMKKEFGLEFKNIWASEEADKANDEYGGHKPLPWLWDQGIFSPSDTFLIDDHPNLIATYKKKNAKGKDVTYASLNSKNAFNIPPFEPEDDPEDAAEDDGLLQAIEEMKKVNEGKRFCRAYAKMPKAKKGGRKTRRKTKTRQVNKCRLTRHRIG